MQIACSKSHRYRFVYCVISGCNSWLTWSVVSSADSAFSVEGLSWASLPFPVIALRCSFIVWFAITKGPGRKGPDQLFTTLYAFESCPPFSEWHGSTLISPSRLMRVIARSMVLTLQPMSCDNSFFVA